LPFLRGKIPPFFFSPQRKLVAPHATASSCASLPHRSSFLPFFSKSNVPIAAMPRGLSEDEAPFAFSLSEACGGPPLLLEELRYAEEMAEDWVPWMISSLMRIERMAKVSGTDSFFFAQRRGESLFLLMG